jgi:hypothetical protein
MAATPVPQETGDHGERATSLMVSLSEPGIRHLNSAVDL